MLKTEEFIEGRCYRENLQSLNSQTQYDLVAQQNLLDKWRYHKQFEVMRRRSGLVGIFKI